MPEYALPKDQRAVSIACDAAEALAAKAEWPETEVTRVVLALGEAVGNAVEHGPKGGGIHLILAVRPDRIDAAVHDGGPGPSRALLIDPTLPDSPSATGGRGLYMIRHLSDSVHIDTEGALCLQFLRTA